MKAAPTKTSAARRPPPAPTVRGTWGAVDTVLLALVLAAVAVVAWRVQTVLVYRWNWRPVLDFVARVDPGTGQWTLNLLGQGLLTTLRLAVWGTLLAGLIGLVMGYWRTCETLALRLIARAYVELVRNIPPLVFIFIFYFFIGNLIFPALGLARVDAEAPWLNNPVARVMVGDPRLFTNFLSGLVCLALFEGAYITEIVRAGIQAVPRGQWEGARAIGLTRRRVLLDVIFPQALRRVLPPLAGQFISLIKDSSIVSLISVQELTFLGSEVAATTSRVFETWLVVAGLYFVLCSGLAALFARAERGARRGQR